VTEVGSPATVRAAGRADADAVAAVHVASWRAVYGGLFPSRLIAAQTLPRRRRQWGRLLREPSHETWVAEVAGGVVGFCNFGPPRDDDLPASVAEVYAIYLLSEVWGLGIGSALWRVAAKQLADHGFVEVAVWLLASNARALAFYRRHGLVHDGWNRSDTFEGEVVEQIRLRGSLDPTA
jgi:ribosomal protein S18 acetylase RimI-like enzyme